MEKFKAVDLLSKQGKEKIFYFIVLYSNLGYLLNVSICEQDYNYLSSINLNELDINSIIEKKYSNKLNKVYYTINLSK